ncbi:MAG TPA: DUF4160 domain-containing protein [Pirellulales bacterium]|jgi:hypothetical protein|nr:DUF4160 domain-containing protein [Pirellulales bacterium]
MPRISQFYGIAVYMYYRDHAPPHFHAIYGEHEAEIDIETGNVCAGSLPARAMGLVQDWRLLHVDELRRDWQLARAGQPLANIDPLS